VFRKFLSDILCVASHSPFVIHAGRKKSKKELGIIKEFRSDEKIPPIRPKPSRQLSLPSDSPISRKKTQPERIAQAAGSSLSKSILRLLHFQFLCITPAPGGKRRASRLLNFTPGRLEMRKPNMNNDGLQPI
jgi:hypothetical protein